MVVIAAISVGVIIIAVSAGISWLALEVFFFMLSRGLNPLSERERVDSNEGLIKRVDRLAGLAT